MRAPVGYCWAILLLSSALGACAPSPAVTILRTGADGPAEAVRGDAVKLKRGPREHLGSAHGGYYVVRGREDWDQVWPAGKAPPMPSDLETNRHMLVLGVAESKAVTQIKVQRAVETATTLYVWIHETTLGEHCVPKRERAVDAAVTGRVEKPVKVFVSREQAGSCGEPPKASVECRHANADAWSRKLTADPGDTVECLLKTSAQGKFELVDRLLGVAELPPGSASKLAFTKGPERASMELDVYGTYLMFAEATDEAGRRGKGTASIEVRPPKTKDVLVQLAWTGFDRKDESNTFPRVNLRVADEGPLGQRCSAEIPVPGLCDVKTRGAYTYMRIPAGSRKLPVSVQFIDERAADGPGPCVHVWYDGVRTADTCDPSHRDADDIWKVGVLDTTTGKLLDEEPAAPEGEADAPASD